MASDSSMIIHSIHKPDQRAEIVAFLMRSVPTNLYQIDILKNLWSQPFVLFECLAVYKRGEPISVVVTAGRPFKGLPAGMCVPYGDLEGCRLLGHVEAQHGGTRHVMGRREACDAFYEGLGEPDTTIFCDERLFYADFIPEEGSYLPLRLASLCELETLLPMVAQMEIEDLGRDPRVEWERYKTSLIQRITQERILVGEYDGSIAFLIEIGTRCDLGTQVGTVFVSPAYRNKGLGRRGIRGCLAYLLGDSAMVTLLARESNLPAMRMHERTGFTKGAPFRLICM